MRAVQQGHVVVSDPPDANGIPPRTRSILRRGWGGRDDVRNLSAGVGNKALGGADGAGHDLLIYLGKRSGAVARVIDRGCAPNRIRDALARPEADLVESDNLGPRIAVRGSKLGHGRWNIDEPLRQGRRGRLGGGWGGSLRRRR